jgi:hypothetical protein
LLLLATSSIQLFPISLVTALDSSDDSSNQFRRDFLPSINDTLISQRSVLSGDGGRETVFIPTGEIPVVPFTTAFHEYLLSKELAAGMTSRTRTGSRISKVAEQQLVTKQQSVPKQQLVVNHQPVAKQQLGAKNSEGVASTEKADSSDSEVPPVVAIKKARTSTALPNGILVKVVVYDAAGKTTQRNSVSPFQLDRLKEFPHRVRANVRTISPPGNVGISFVLGSGQLCIGFECGYNAIGFECGHHTAPSSLCNLPLSVSIARRPAPVQRSRRLHTQRHQQHHYQTRRC